MLQLKVCQYLHRSLLRVLDGLRLAAEEGVHLCLSLIVFGDADFKYLNALFRDVFLKCECEVKEKKATMSIRQIVISAAAGLQKQKSSKGYVWRRGATPGTHGISSASGSSFSMLLTRLGPFRCSTNASWTKIIWKSGNPHKLESQVNLMAFPYLLAIIPCAACVAVSRRLQRPFGPRVPQFQSPPERSDI